MKSFEEVYEAVKKELSEERFHHSVCVMERCVEFATLNNEDVEKAKLIGIAHDIAKEIPRELRIKIAEEHGVILDEFEKENLSLIHAKLGAKLCEEMFGFSKDMCDAIAFHTTAKSNMTKLQKILYLSDYSEVSRDYEGAIKAYGKGKENLDEGYFMALVGKIEYMLKKNVPIHHDSIDAYNDFLYYRK